jgi:hypothetical protein
MRRKHYVCPDEVLFRDRLPADGQRIAFRGYAQKTYFTGRWDAARRVVLTGPAKAPESEAIELDATHGHIRLFGWAALPDPG